MNHHQRTPTQIVLNKHLTGAQPKHHHLITVPQNQSNNPNATHHRPHNNVDPNQTFHQGGIPQGPQQTVRSFRPYPTQAQKEQGQPSSTPHTETGPSNSGTKRTELEGSNQFQSTYQEMNQRSTPTDAAPATKRRSTGVPKAKPPTQI